MKAYNNILIDKDILGVRNYFPIIKYILLSVWIRNANSTKIWFHKDKGEKLLKRRC
jgi:hypothetical protein